MNSIAKQLEAKILTVVVEQRCILLEEVLTRLPELTWTQVFAIVDELSRRGLICLRRRGFEYELRTPFGEPDGLSHGTMTHSATVADVSSSSPSPPGNHDHE